jgi:hypothetical protein
MDLSHERRKADEKVVLAIVVDVDCAVGRHEGFNAVYCAYRYVRYVMLMQIAMHSMRVWRNLIDQS